MSLIKFMNNRVKINKEKTIKDESLVNNELFLYVACHF